jgi:two-component system KDP operon response regulator KdpE
MTAMTEAARKTCALLVEDDPNIVDLIRSNLAVRGFDTVVSVDGMRALQLLETEDPDIVLLDLMLPEADGFELCRQIRERSPVAIIVVSARGGERDKVTALHMGADDYMTKPFSGSPPRCAAPVPPRRPSRRLRSSWSATSSSTWLSSRCGATGSRCT